MTTLFAVLHHLAVLTLLVCTLLTFRQLGQPFTVPGARLLRKADMVVGIAATLVLLVGLVRVFYLEKGFAYYFQNGPFLTKLGFYGLASLLSVISLVELHRWRMPLKSGLLPALSTNKLSTLRTVAVLQLACLAAMAMCANLAAHGNDWG